MEIRALRPGDDRAGFVSGDEALDRFFHLYAGQNQFRHFLGVTYVAVEGARVLGFVTVAPRHLDVEGLPAREKKRLPKDPVPVLGLARLAVDASARSSGIGAQLLRFVARLAREVGCAGIVVDAKAGAVAFYERFGFTPFEAIEGESSARPRPVPMWLPIQAILKAEEPEH